ncbi:hypothetical protein BGZ76_002756 [Entomortierella beljakovae]|nr:hypothetical protein BGZ76_002756 [Entomortierella beljakovae]
MTRPEATAKPEVLIVGAGIAGLMLALLLEQINIPYHVFERAQQVKPLGSAMSFGPPTLTALDQLGILDDLIKISKPYEEISFYTGNAKNIGGLDFKNTIETYGYNCVAFSRPEFYEILLKRVPAEKISFKKKILKGKEKDGRVHIYCADNTSYSGDILVGADGAYSGVRQSMYKSMEDEGTLPKSDMEGFSIGYTVIVGVAKASDPEKYPILKKELCKFDQVVYNGSNNCYIMTLPNNQIAWGFGTQLPRSTLKDMHFRNSEWNAEASEATLDEFGHFPSTIGGTMKEIFDATPKELISKVYLEEKLFKTWHHGRTVLVGDACHKLHPAGGQGASNALYDAIVLANCLYALKDTSSASLTAAFEEYYTDRYEFASMAFTSSSGMAKLLNGQKFTEKLFRKIVLNCIPTWVFNASLEKTTRYRPQVAWLPLVKSGYKGKLRPQHFEKNKEANAISR